MAIPTLLLVVLFAGTASAASLPTDVEGSFQCNYEGNQQEMNACALRDYKMADVTLNKVYKATISKLTLEKQKVLRQQQRFWLKDRDPHCKEEVKQSEGGSIWQLDYFSCLKTATELRTKTLENWTSNR
ncbi:lysozyme inhibitor LprI family protein [Methylomonas sp. ZR1]|uniref:lysozyme inhibitor LprI family protein n=1 Tax=Methylomonas sp. ZR1 TaxID=1797072 RepID=UPI0014922586|nr:lysozyme inhibitor LprI family protein [Methylomonas sp. ZR1]NOV31826.1 DUF1311 domain-containing protein [Methylomonas sp. ZR1]